MTKLNKTMAVLMGQIIVLLMVSVLIPSTKQGKTCGRPLGVEYLIEDDRIVAGYDLGYYKYPWYAALIMDDQVACGATLVGPKTVITAAHCYKGYLDFYNKGLVKLEEIYTVKLGLYNICATEETQREYKIKKVQVHKLFKNHYHDICLITLEGDTSNYEPICLPDKGVAQSQRPKEGLVTGLGTLTYHGALPCTMHEARILIYPDEKCNAMIKTTGNKPEDRTKAFCAGYIEGGIDACQGDSGGPLQVINENGDYVLLGIVSFGFHCAQPGLLGMYTDVSQYVEWIKEKSEFGLKSLNEDTGNSQEDSEEIGPSPLKNVEYYKEKTWPSIGTIILRKNNTVLTIKPNSVKYEINTIN